MLFIEINPWTKLGNWMFEYAAAISTGEDVCLYGVYDGWRKDIAPYVETIFKEAILHDGRPEGLEVYEAPTFRYHALPSFKGRDVDFRGYFQSEKFFDKERIRKLYGVPEESRKYLLGKYGEWLNDPGVTGISVRRGDYLKKPESHPFVGKDFLRKAMAKFPVGTKFVVCSDDIAWCKEFFKGEEFLFVSGETAMNQMFVHSLCHHNIISNSSFSWWGAWLNEHEDKRVIAPSLWFGFGLSDDDSDLLWDGVEVIKNHYSVSQYIAGHVNVAVNAYKRKFYPLYCRLLRR